MLRAYGAQMIGLHFRASSRDIPAERKSPASVQPLETVGSRIAPIPVHS